MKIIISPSKLQNYDKSGKDLKEPLFAEKSAFLREKLENLSRSEMTEFFKLKSAKADEVYQLFQKGNKEEFAPFDFFSGIVFKEINYNSYDDIQLAYLDQHAVILSAMYGVIEADNALKPYRLDFTKRLAGINLYQYWQEEIDNYFSNCQLVINLASKEYSKLLKHYKSKQLNIFFQEMTTTGKLKTVTVHSKQMRGIMFDYLVRHCITEINALKDFTENGYLYNEELSTEWDWYFVKGE